MNWPFKKTEAEMTQQQLIQAEQKNAIIQSNFDPKMPIDEEQQAQRKEAYAQIMQWQQDRNPVLIDIFSGFAGLRLTKEGFVTDAHNKSVCNVWAAKKIVEFIRPQDHNAMLANWDERKINSELMSIAEGLMDYITMNNEDMDVGINNFEYVVDTVVLAQHPSYQRGFNDGERKVVKETIKVSEVNPGERQKIQQKVFGIPVSS